MIATPEKLTLHQMRRFFGKFDFPVKKNDCWPWKGAKIPQGYGAIRIQDEFFLAHRVAYEQWRGSIPTDLILDHLCHNRSCVNPAHLEAVTHQVNILRGTGATARHARKAQCPCGLPYTTRQYRVGKEGRTREVRGCKVCRSKYRREYRIRTGN